MDIYIKSFNRVYYLDRCIHSIYTYLKGNFNVVVLDDGTPSHFLDELQIKYPTIIIKKSPHYFLKSQAIIRRALENEPYNVSGIPDSFWYQNIEAGSEYFLLLEDDIWLTQHIDLDELLAVAESQQLGCIKLYWGGNPKVVQGNPIRNGSIEVLTNIPLPIKSSLLFRLFLSKRTKLYSIAKRLGFLSYNFFLPYYSMYAVAGAFFSKQYWTYLWEGSNGKVDEQKQLQKVLSYREKYRVRFAKSIVESCDTSFITSTTNYYPQVELDFIALNYQINLLWLQGHIDVTDRFPKDFDAVIIKKLLQEHGTSTLTSDLDEWDKWIIRFKEQYRNLGFKIE